MPRPYAQSYWSPVNKHSNIWDEHHIFPLHWAVQSGDARICEVLIKAGADVNARTDVWNRVGGHTPLHYCNIPSANLSVIKLLLDNGADPNLRCRSFPSSHTALQNLILRGRPIVAFEVIDLLGDRARFSKLQAMIYSENLEVVRSMLGNGYDAKSKVPQGGSVLAYARRLNRRRQAAKLMPRASFFSLEQPQYGHSWQGPPLVTARSSPPPNGLEVACELCR